MADRRQAVTGILCGMGAGALWGMVFLAPELAHDFSPLQLTVGRYLCFGLVALGLAAPRWRRLTAAIGRREWGALAWLALAGNTLYYVLLASAVQLGGIAMTSLVIGFLPVAVTIIGSRDRGAVPLRRLVPSLLLCVAGALCIGWQALAVPGASQVLGLLCAIGALASWTSYAVGNSRWLARLDQVSAHDWNLLTGVMTGAQALLLVPLALILAGDSPGGAAWARFGAVSVGVAVLASVVGNALWNRMSRSLPLTLVGQMILFETLFALLYGFLWEQRWPGMLEALAFALVVLSVLSCIAAHRRPAPALATPAVA
ncbi:multidrug DMT transporter permease [Pseudoroseomonas deserti]|uniref:Multidrug DMT transporter permease n=1 Tax=Teichococcus deserti TaxID=1817963 RepID=A0A1V2GYU6_9PROT|nr:DMT family transporter [Pseudoroseomonas deserti]ONG50037.1 multidrug DMT transporter permease [Pseudoroseomonas deserti]